jgi:NAD-dependent dihydropyrimidine dehydrogenase PreA subunit
LSNLDAPWFPLIFSDKCDGCVRIGKPRCVEYCPNGVFMFQDGKAVVAYPTKCVKGCSACAPLCHKKALSFPARNALNMQMKEEDKGMIRKTTCKVCGKQYWTNRDKDVCFDCDK